MVIPFGKFGNTLHSRALFRPFSLDHHGYHLTMAVLMLLAVLG